VFLRGFNQENTEEDVYAQLGKAKIKQINPDQNFEGSFELKMNKNEALSLFEE
jgi:hypothetical protein